MNKYLKNNKGLTLIEIIVSIALLSLIVMGFMQLFTVSAIVTSKSKDTLEATYTGKDAMELIYDLSTRIPYEELDQELLSLGYSKVSKNIYAHNTPDGKTIELKLSEDRDLVNVLATVLNRGKEETKYEAYYHWKGQGDSNEEQ